MGMGKSIKLQGTFTSLGLGEEVRMSGSDSGSEGVPLGTQVSLVILIYRVTS